MLIDVRDSCLIVVDVQERLAPAIADHERLICRCTVILQAARRLEVPLLASEHCPQGLGPTIAALASELGPEHRIEKRHFSCLAEPEFRGRLDRFGCKQAVLCGAETHVCVLQTALDLQAAGTQVFLVADATGSRDPRDRDVALARLAQAGGVVVTTEMVVFEWLRRADTPAFKDLLTLIK